MAFLDSLKSGKTTVPPPSGTGGPPAKLPVTQTITHVLKPNADVTALLIQFDQLMIVNNPFDVGSVSTVPGLSLADPISWLVSFGNNVWNDALSVTIRSAFLLVGGWIILKVCNEFLDYGALIDGARSRVGVS